MLHTGLADRAHLGVELDRQINALISQFALVREPAPLTDSEQMALLRLCQLFLDSDEPGRAQIRGAVLQNETVVSLLDNLPRHVAALLSNGREQDARRLLRSALAGFAMANIPTDVRDSLVSLMYLYRAANSAGLNAAAEFRLAAEWDSDVRPRGSWEGQTVKTVLSEFSDAYGRNVDRHIADYERR